MKKLLILVTSLSLFVAACSEQKKEEKLKADLKTKKEEFEKLRKEITEMQMELNKLDTTGGDKGKPVRVVTLAPSRFVHSIDIQGRVDAEESVTVGPQMPGLVKRVYVQAGDKVSAGQVLAEIDADAIMQQLAALKVQRDLAKQVFDRQKNLWDQKIGTELQFLQSQTQYQALDKQVAAVQEQVDMARVKAPMSGVVDQVNMKAGEMAAVGFASISIVNTNSLTVKAEVAESYIAQVQTGNPVSIYLPDAGKTIEAKITYAGRMISKMNRTFIVEVALRANEPNVVPNMLAVLKINDYSKDSAIVVPVSAVQESASGKKFVFVAEKNKEGQLTAKKREVSYTHSYNGTAEIESGLKAGEQLITEGVGELNEGDVIAGK